MFEVDWADYDQEKVGQRRARKDIERELKKKEDASSSHGTRSARTSTSSDQRHLSFFGSIRRKRFSAYSSKSKKQEATAPKPESIKSDSNPNRSSTLFSQAAGSSAIQPTDNVSEDPEIELPDAQALANSTGAARCSDHTWPGSPDRSSKESAVSRVTQLTIPTLDLQRKSALTDDAAATESVQMLGDGFVAENMTTTYQHGGSMSSPPSQVGVGSKTTTTLETSRTPKSPQHPLSLPEATISTSEAIDNWCTALHGPTRQLPKPGPSGTLRRGDVLLPPNISRPIPVTPTRRSAKRTVLTPPNPSPIKFVADNPDDWKTPDEWNMLSSTGAPGLAPVSNKLEEKNEETAHDEITTQLRSLMTWEKAVEDDKDGQEDDGTTSLRAATDMIVEVGSQAAPLEEVETTSNSNRPTRETIQDVDSRVHYVSSCPFRAYNLVGSLVVDVNGRGGTYSLTNAADGCTGRN